MTYNVIIDPKAHEQLELAFQWWAKHRSVDQSVRWYNGFMDRLLTLESNPGRWALAPENDSFPFEVRQLLYALGSKPTHRALFTIQPDLVYIFAIRHVAQEPITPDQF